MASAKKIFEQVYQNVLRLHGRISNMLTGGQKPTGFDELLHDAIKISSLAHYHSGDFRNAVLDGILAISDKIRARTGLDFDGDRLCSEAFSPRNPILVFSEIETESGKNDQVGFIEILKGVYKGIRNPKAHSLDHDLDKFKAAQYLILISILMRRVEDSKMP
ncbi:MAG: TIGR02391 family protein [Pseudomonadota bacterium]